MSKFYVCRACLQDAHTFVQPGLMPGRKPALQVECVNPTCPAYKHTLDSRDTVEIDRLFIVEDDSGDDLTLEFLQRRVRSLVLLSGRGNRPTLERLGD